MIKETEKPETSGTVCLGSFASTPSMYDFGDDDAPLSERLGKLVEAIKRENIEALSGVEQRLGELTAAVKSRDQADEVALLKARLLLAERERGELRAKAADKESKAGDAGECENPAGERLGGREKPPKEQQPKRFRRWL